MLAIVVEDDQHSERMDGSEQGLVHTRLRLSRPDAQGGEYVGTPILIGRRWGRNAEAPIRTEARQHFGGQVFVHHRPDAFVHGGADRCACVVAEKITAKTYERRDIQAAGHRQHGVVPETTPQIGRQGRLRP